jgi:hypothetical protein
VLIKTSRARDTRFATRHPSVSAESEDAAISGVNERPDRAIHLRSDSVYFGRSGILLPLVTCKVHEVQ